MTQRNSIYGSVYGCFRDPLHHRFNYGKHLRMRVTSCQSLALHGMRFVGNAGRCWYHILGGVYGFAVILKLLGKRIR